MHPSMNAGKYRPIISIIDPIFEATRHDASIDQCREVSSNNIHY